MMCLSFIAYVYKGGEMCFDTISVQQRGDNRFSSPRQVIVPRANFTCSGRITGITASMNRVTSGTTAPYLEVWHQTTPGISVFDKVGEVQLVESEIVEEVDGNSLMYYFVNITLTDDDRIEFEAGDVIGYYQLSNSRYQVWSVSTAGYTAYSNQASIPLNESDLVKLSIGNNRRPLIQLTTGLYIIL